MSSRRQLEEHLTPAQVAARLGIHISTVWRQVAEYHRSAGKRGLGPAYKLGRRCVRIPASGVHRWLEQCQVTLT